MKSLLVFVGVLLIGVSSISRAEVYGIAPDALKVEKNGIASPVKVSREHRVTTLTTGPHRESPLAEESKAPSEKATDYITYCESFRELVVFGYAGTGPTTAYYVDTLDNTAAPSWWAFSSGLVNQDNYKSVTMPVKYSQCRVKGSNKYGLLTGDPISSLVMGYYAVDQNGKGASIKLLTYMPASVQNDGTEKLIVFAYANGTSGQVSAPSTGYTATFSLNAGERYVETSNVYGKFVIVTANLPVTVLSYGDQGYYVPCGDGLFTGTLFYTFIGRVGWDGLGNDAPWTHDVNIISYTDGASVTIKNTNTGATLWGPTTVNKGRVATYSATNQELYLTIESTGKIAVAVQPFVSYAENYYQLATCIDESGDGIGTLFYVLSLKDPTGLDPREFITGFPYFDNTTVTIDTLSPSGVWATIGSVTLTPAGNDFWLNQPQNRIYRVTANKEISCYSWCADVSGSNVAGADFTPLWWTDPSGVEESIIHKKFGITAAPNPFVRSTTIKIRAEGPALVELFDVTGRKVATIFEGMINGEHEFRWDRSGRETGVYFLKITTTHKSLSTKLILL